MIKAKITTINLAGNYREIVEDFKSEAHLQDYLKARTLSPYSKLIGVNTNSEILTPDCDPDEEILSDCCGADSWWSDESLCGQCFEHADFS